MFNDKIRFVYFDFDNVLVERVVKRSEKLARELGVGNPAALRDFYFSGFKRDTALLEDYLSLKTVDDEVSFYKDIFRIYAGTIGIDLPEHRLAAATKEFIFAPQKIKAGATAGLMALKPKYRLGILTNGLPSRHDEIESSGLANYFDEILISSDFGIEKPDQAIYLKAVQASELPPSRIALVDDLPENLNGALAVGFGQAIQFNDSFWQRVSKSFS